MKVVLFPLHDLTGETVAVAGASEAGELFDQVLLLGRSREDIIKELATSVKATYAGAVVTFTEQPELHPIVQKAVDLHVEEDAPAMSKRDNFLCSDCTHSHVCSVASAIVSLQTIDIRVTSCEAYELKEKDNARKKKRV